MLQRRLAAAAAACIVMFSSSMLAFAEDNEHKTDESSQASSQTESTADSESSAESGSSDTSSEAASSDTSSEDPASATTTSTTTTTTTTTTSVTAPPETTTTAKKMPVTEASRAALSVSDVVDGTFSVTLKLVPSTTIAGAKIKVEYDSSLFRLTGSKINKEDIGGMPSENKKDGVYTFTYLNPAGVDFSGEYATLQFRVLDDKADSSVMYINVESLEDMDLLDVPCNEQNGIVRIRKDIGVDPASFSDGDDLSGTTDDQLHTCKVRLATQLVTLDEIGVPDVLYVRSVKIKDPQYAYYEKGALMLTQAGETEMIINYMSGKELRFRLIIEADETSPAPVVPEEKQEPDNSGRNLFIGAVIMFAIAAIALEYMFIVKPFRAKKGKQDDDEPEERFVAYDDDDAPDLVQDPKEVFARRVRPDKIESTNDKPKQRSDDDHRSRQQGRRPSDRGRK